VLGDVVAVDEPPSEREELLLWGINELRCL
jgi:hypothetical protein